ncbi:hypothetical protein AOLI_G00275710 [Acnodon oligacanthus]
MAFSPRLVYLAVLVLASLVMLSNAAVRVSRLRATNLPGDSLGYRPDPYVKAWCAGVSGGKSETVKDTYSPIWKKEFNFPSCKPKSTLRLEVWDKDISNDDLLGRCTVMLSSGSFSNAKCAMKKDKAMTSRLMLVAILVTAAHLPLTDAAVRLWGLRAFNLKGDPIGPPDPYIKVWCSSTFGGMTEFHKNNANPIWTVEFNFPNCKAFDNLQLEVWDKDTNFDDLLETCLTQVRSGTHVNNNCMVGKGSLSYNYELI